MAPPPEVECLGEGGKCHPVDMGYPTGMAWMEFSGPMLRAAPPPAVVAWNGSGCPFRRLGRFVD